MLLGLTTAQAQQAFNPNNVLIISKEDSKRDGLMRTGQTIKCKLKDGNTVKGKLYVYSDHIVVDKKRVEFNEVKMIKLVNAKFLASQAGNIALNEIIRRETNSSLGSAYLIRSVIFFGISYFLFNKKYNTAKGWELSVRELQAINFRRRAYLSFKIRLNAC
ncbi:hypothetical protein BFP97_16320 [Roseivirga sp. 4D4]|nr:hypothetical protein BFP97_16320 [Roseivirga sp. 4D4]